jgi:succinate dehydrogenase/fumarate reductase flavoprotein subunit
MRSNDAELPEMIDAAAIEHWDEEADVLVIGYGMAGACAALEALRAGADVLIVERYSGFGGSSASAGGHFYLGGGTDVQKATGFQDSPEEMEKYLNAIGPVAIPEKVHAYSFDSVEHFHWLEAQGVPFERSFFAEKTIIQPGSEGLIWTGCEEVYPFRELAKPAPRGHKVAFPGQEGGGALAMRHLDQRITSEGGRVLTDARVDALVRGDEGVCGVRVRLAGGETRHLKAHRGVVLAGGGFGQNRAMLEKYIPQYAAAGDRVYWIGAPGDDGSAIRLGQSAGGAVMQMGELHATCFFYPPEQLVKGILVNAKGERFVAEDSYHSRTAAHSVQQPDGIAYLLLDSEIFAYPENHERMGQELVDGWETIEEMETGLELPRGSLSKTIADYNADCRNKSDTAFHKHPKYLKPLDQPPYAAFDLSFGRATYSAFTLGGLQTTLDGKVIGEDGNPISGLFAAGSCSSSLAQNSDNYASGLSLGQASYFGRRAGRAAAKLQALDAAGVTTDRT